MTSFGENVQQPQFLILNPPLIPGSRFAPKFWAGHFSLLYQPLTSCKVLEENNEQSLRCLKTDRHTHTRTRVITKDPFG